MEETAIIAQQDKPLARELSPIQQLQLQIIREGDIEKLKQLREMEREWRAEQAKLAYIEAMAQFKEEPAIVRIVKDKENKAYRNKDKPDTKGTAFYASLGSEASTIVPLLSRHGFTGNWNLSQSSAGIAVSYTLTHKAGHSGEPVTITLPPDASGNKNAAQQIKSAITYGRIITLECACGIAPVDSAATLDDDANATSEGMDEELFLHLLEEIQGATSADELKSAFFAALDAAKAAGDQNAMKSFEKAKLEAWRNNGGFR